MSTGVDKLIEANSRAAELHRIAYGEAMYNQAINDAISSLCGSGMFSQSTQESILDELSQLKKPIPQTQTENKE